MEKAGAPEAPEREAGGEKEMGLWGNERPVLNGGETADAKLGAAVVD